MRFLLILLALIFCNSFNKNLLYEVDVKHSPDFLHNYYWADSVMQTLTLQEKVGQLFFVSADLDSNYLSYLIDSFHIGGLTFFKGSLNNQAEKTNYYQQKSKIPLLISIDAEWGLHMRISECQKFPWPMTLGAIEDDSLIFDYSTLIARNMKRLGVHVNFAPVVDVNSNPKNPIIYNRSFGESYTNVTDKSLAYFYGHESENIFCTAKHFPGHGDTEQDSHKTLPKVKRSKSLLDSVDLFPYQRLISSGLGGVMVAHLDVLSLDSLGLPSTLSSEIIKGLLKEEMGYNGLVITDGLNMKAVSDSFPSGELEVMSLLAGNDILLLPQNVPLALEKIQHAINNGILNTAMINDKCRKVLMLKKWVGLDKHNIIDTTNLYHDIVNEDSDLMHRKLVESSLTLLKNKNDLLPLKSIDTLDIACLLFGDNKNEIFQNTLTKYADISFYNFSDNIDVILEKINKHNLLILSIHENSKSPWARHDFNEKLNDFISKIDSEVKIVTVHFANPYSLNSFDSHNYVESVLMSYQNDDIFQDYSAQLIFGGIESKGFLPVSTNYFKINTGLKTKKIRLKYTVPLELGIYKESLNKIDSIIQDAIKRKAMPGCQVAFSKDGKVFYQKAFGYYTYRKKYFVNNDNIYDLASLTKITVSTPLLMNMVESQYLNIDSSLHCYLKDIDTTNKSELKIKNILSHNSGLKSWIPFYKNTLKNRRLNSEYYRKSKSKDFGIEVASDIFLMNTFKDSIYNYIVNSDIDSNPAYRYSDLGYYLFQPIIEERFDQSLDIIIENNFFSKLGMTNTMYSPLQKVEKVNIIPSEKDRYFRNQTLSGYVHDMGAAMLGGVAGHAGLFSNSNDLLKISELYLKEGVYGDQVYINDTIFALFNKYHFSDDDNRRGLGFDKPALKVNESSSCSKYASSSSFGHSGFTGNLMWIDPEYNLNYVFLSNRTYPTSRNKKLIDMNIRTKIHDVMYEIFAEK